MKNILISLYKKYLNMYYYKKYDITPAQQKEMEISKQKELAYQGVRNVLGACLFFSALMLFILITGKCFLDLQLDLGGDHKLIGILIFSLLVLSYLSMSKKHLKPLFQEIVPDDLSGDEIKKAKRFFVYALVSGGVFGGSMYVIARLTFIFVCR